MFILTKRHGDEDTYKEPWNRVQSLFRKREKRHLGKLCKTLKQLALENKRSPSSDTCRKKKKA